MTPIPPNVVYKSKYVVMVNPEEFKKWREGGETVPLDDVVNGPLDIRHKDTKGKLSIQELETFFETSDHEEAIKRILREGDFKGSADDDKRHSNIRNEARGSRSVDTRGNSLTGI